MSRSLSFFSHTHSAVTSAVDDVCCCNSCLSLFIIISIPLLRACRALGVLEHDLFETVDLFEEKSMNTVVLCIFALGRTIQVDMCFRC
jgi:hypothetical protein